MPQSEWLLFGLPDCGEAFLVDWRARWHVVDPGERVKDLAAIHGFTGEYLHTLPAPVDHRTTTLPPGRRLPKLRRLIEELRAPS